MDTLWMVRCEGGNYFEDFRDHRLVALGWQELADVTKGMERDEVIGLLRQRRPDQKEGTVISGASQVWRFVNEVAVGDGVVTYSPSLRKYLIGRVTAESRVDKVMGGLEMPLVRDVEWRGEVDRDALTVAAKGSLGSTLTLFKVSDIAREELLSKLEGAPAPEARASNLDTDLESVAQVVDMLEDSETRALEFIKDKVMALDWSEMQELVAGILRAMGYKTRVARAGSDRGADVIASPDGLGFETPRIVVEVKHRKAQTDSTTVRSFLGGRHKDDRGLFVSTGGFSKDARYEADRAGIPVMLWGLDELVGYLIEYYETLDSDTRQMAPLKRVYWPA